MGEQLLVHKLDKGRVFLWERGDHLLTIWWIPNEFQSIYLFHSVLLKGFVKVWCIQGWREPGSDPRTSDYTLWAPNPLDSRTHDQTLNQDFWPRWPVWAPVFCPPAPLAGLGCVRRHHLPLSMPSMIHRTSKIMLCIKLGSYFVHTWFKSTDSSLWSFSNNFQFFSSRLMI